MSLAAKIRRAPQRTVTGVFLLSTGLDKVREADDATAKGIHDLAADAYPVLGKVDPKVFLKALGIGEMALGGALLLPIVSPAVAGLGLVAFSGALLGAHWRASGVRHGSDVGPAENGTAIAKDAWMFAVGTGLVADALLAGAHDKKVELVGTVKGVKKGAKAAGAASGATAEALTAIHAASDAAADAARTARTRAAAQTRDAVESAREKAHAVRERVA